MTIFFFFFFFFFLFFFFFFRFSPSHSTFQSAHGSAPRARAAADRLARPWSPWQQRLSAQCGVRGRSCTAPAGKWPRAWPGTIFKIIIIIIIIVTSVNQSKHNHNHKHKHKHKHRQRGAMIRICVDCNETQPTHAWLPHTERHAKQQNNLITKKKKKKQDTYARPLAPRAKHRPLRARAGVLREPPNRNVHVKRRRRRQRAPQRSPRHNVPQHIFYIKKAKKKEEKKKKTQIFELFPHTHTHTHKQTNTPPPIPQRQHGARGQKRGTRAKNTHIIF
jgi:hypothetical protein